MVAHVAIEVRRAFPYTHGGEMWRLHPRLAATVRYRRINLLAELKALAIQSTAVPLVDIVGSTRQVLVQAPWPRPPFPARRSFRPIAAAVESRSAARSAGRCCFIG